MCLHYNIMSLKAKITQCIHHSIILFFNTPEKSMEFKVKKKKKKSAESIFKSNVNLDKFH